MKSDDYAALLARVDAAVDANLCACGCGQQIPARGPSPDFINEKHQRVWTARGYRASGGKVAADWYTRLRELEPVVETPMARVVRETSALRKAIDKIRGIRP